MKIVNCKLKIAKQKGFTLIEIMVVIAIAGVLAGVAIVNFGRNPDRDVRLEKDRLVTFLRSVQNKTLAAEKVSGVDEKICGFGVFFKEDEQKISVFYVYTKIDAALLYDNKLDVPCENDVVDKKRKIGTNSVFAANGEFFVFKNNVTADSFSDIFFLAPNGNIYSDGSLISSDMRINVTKTGLGSSVPITITQGGIIK